MLTMFSIGLNQANHKHIKQKLYKSNLIHMSERIPRFDSCIMQMKASEFTYL